MKQLYEQQNNVNASNATGTDVNESRLREEMKENTSDMLEDHPSTQDLARVIRFSEETSSIFVT